jgi:hypothetical protein
MKHLLLLTLLISSIYNTLFAQGFKDVRLNFGFQGNFPERVFNDEILHHNNKNGGGGIHLYPKWFYNNQNSIGLNMEYVLVTENFQTDNIGEFNIISFFPTFNHYFFTSKIRPFVGIGIGSYSVIYHSPKFNLGIMPLLGISFGKYFDLSLEYNRILNKINIDPMGMGDFDNYYFGVKGSFSVGLLRSKN